MVAFTYYGTAVRAVALGIALICTSCATASLVTPAMHGQAPGSGETACLVRGLGGPLTSYVAAGRDVLEQLGFTVALYEMTISPNALRPCAVIVAHSAGAVSALATVGHRQIFIIDGFASFLQRCPDEATCTNFYNPGDILSGSLAGAQNVNCFTSCGVLMPCLFWLMRRCQHPAKYGAPFPDRYCSGPSRSPRISVHVAEP